MNGDTAGKLRTLTLGQRQDLLLRHPSLSDPQPTPQALDALSPATTRDWGAERGSPAAGQSDGAKAWTTNTNPSKGF